MPLAPPKTMSSSSPSWPKATPSPSSTSLPPLSRRGLRVSLITTPANAPFIRRRLPATRHPLVALHSLPFPLLQPLPPGVESTDALPSPDLYPAFHRATALLADPFDSLLRHLVQGADAPPLCLISDFFLWWTFPPSAELSLPRISFQGASAFATCLCRSLGLHRPFNNGAATFHVPGTPPSLLLTQADVPQEIRNLNNPAAPSNTFVHEIIISHMSSWGLLVNSFAEIEAASRPLRRAPGISPSSGLSLLACWAALPFPGRRRRRFRLRAGPGWLPPVARQEASRLGSVRLLRDAGAAIGRAARRAGPRPRIVRARVPPRHAIEQLAGAPGRGVEGLQGGARLGSAAGGAPAPRRRRVREPLWVELGAGEPRGRGADPSVANDGGAAAERAARGRCPGRRGEAGGEEARRGCEEGGGGRGGEGGDGERRREGPAGEKESDGASAGSGRGGGGGRVVGHSAAGTLAEASRGSRRRLTAWRSRWFDCKEVMQQ